LPRCRSSDADWSAFGRGMNEPGQRFALARLVV
jgi:hypothetical protein